MTHTQDEALRQALEALEIVRPMENPEPAVEEAIAAIKQALEAPVQDVKELFGYEIWNRFYRSKPELLDEMVRPNAGYPLDWIEANIREVYVHGTPAIAKRESETKKGQP